jgi:Zn-dependent M28 family amino/carboxypeptidase
MGCRIDNHRVRARTPAGFAEMAARAVALGSLTMLGAALPARAEGPPTAGDLAVSASRIEADVRFLADDLLEGREAGTRGYDLAALYVASQYRLLGLEPAGEDGTYFQRVPMLRGVREQPGARFAITRDGRTTEFAFESEFLPTVNYTAGAAEVTAPMVFVGQAVRAPELQHDDFAGVDVKGKIAVVLDNAPARFPVDQRAYHASSTEKLRELERLGAVGVIYLGDPVNEQKRPWALDAPNWRRPGMRRLDAQGRPVDDFPGLAVRVSGNVKLADALFEGSPHTPAEVFAMLEAGTLRAFDLDGTATLASRAKLERVESRNVIARLPGSDAQLSAEHVVFTAHLDHVGIGVPRNGDSIYNGAQDNAVGVATMLEAARLLAAGPARPKRSSLFVALTAEEKGLLGAFHFAAQPTVPAASLVANVNMDMPLLLADVTDVIPIGIEHSTLEAVAQRAVADAGLTLTPDPFPEEVVFVRSDQYAFVRQGVPAIYLLAGVKPSDGSDGSKMFTDWLSHHYHLPSDDLSQPIHWQAAARLAYVNYRIGLAIGNDPQRPAWKAGDFFGGKFGR